jgi:hypothetical protein
MASQPAPAPSGHTVRNVVVVIIVIAAILAVLILVPIPHPFSTSLVSSGGAPGTATFDFPAGSVVKGSFSSASGDNVAFGISDPHGGVIYGADASRGSFSFASTGGTYRFTSDSFASETVSVSGTYSIPLLKLQGV